MIGAGAFVRFGGELGDVYEGFLPARRLRGERFELNETETALVGGARPGGEVRLGDPVDGARRAGRGAARPGRSGAGGARRVAMSKQGQAQGGGRRRRDQPPRPHKFEFVETHGGGDRAARQRGEVAARGQGADRRRLRGRRARRGLAAQPPHPPLRAGEHARTTSPSARASCSCTAPRSSA